MATELIPGQLDALALLEPEGIPSIDAPQPGGEGSHPISLPPFCEVIELASPYRHELGNRTVTIRWGFACSLCAGKDMSNSGVGWLTGQAIRAAQLHAQLAHTIYSLENQQ
jgi:hypothetical protein